MGKYTERIKRKVPNDLEERLPEIIMTVLEAPEMEEMKNQLESEIKTGEMWAQIGRYTTKAIELAVKAVL